MRAALRRTRPGTAARPALADAASTALPDLHGLYTAEAIERTERAVRDAQQQGKPELRVIVGKGIHSKDHVAHIKVRSAGSL